MNKKISAFCLAWILCCVGSGVVSAQLNSSGRQQRMVVVPGPVATQLELQDLEIQMKNMQLALDKYHDIQTKDHEFLISFKGTLEFIKWLLAAGLVPLFGLLIQNYRFQRKS